MNTIVAHLGPTVRDARTQKGWSQEHLADLARLDRSYVGEIERGLVSPSLTTLVKLAAALQVAPSELIRHCERRVTTGVPSA
ncbi:MAG: helix-turn-helix transcriptional regulator [Burkholderiaceae bacterium]|jgi:transcriptional regulator with XRE-family HTH domain